jgi:hypothetical protein
MTRRISLLLFVLCLFGAFVFEGCGAARSVPEVRGTVRFTGDPSDAELTVNETHLGPIGMFKDSGVRLRPGKQRVEVSKDGYFTEYRLVDVEADKIIQVEIHLREIP